jgi:putative transposase
MPRRKQPIIKGETYHIVSKSISEFNIFRCDKDYERMLNEILYYSFLKPPYKFSLVKNKKITALRNNSSGFGVLGKIVNILAYCIMPTHIHLIINELCEDGITKFMNLILKSYTAYFNLKYNRRGPLWEGRFKNVLIKNDYQLIHTTRYVHLNPVTAYLVDKPIDWKYSSYREYLGEIGKDEKVCNFSDFLAITKESYAIFVSDQISYQRELASIKHLCLE